MVENTAVRIDPIAPRTFMRLKSWLPLQAGALAPITLDGKRLPHQIGSVSGADTRVLCVRPDEWLLISTQSSATVYEQIVAQAAQQSLAVVDLSDGYGAFSIRGLKAREVLSKSCGLDLHPQSFPQGRCARTRFAQIPIILECIGAQDAFEITAARSYLQYLEDWLKVD